MAKVLDEAQAKPHVLLDNDGTPFWTQDREKARARVREENTRTDSGGFAELIDVDYDPRRFIVHRKFAPDTEAMKKLLKVDLEGGQK